MEIVPSPLARTVPEAVTIAPRIKKFGVLLPSIPPISAVIQFLVAIASGIFISTTWVITGKVARMHPILCWPLAFQYLGASVALYAIPVVLHREFLRLSFKSAQAAVTLSTLLFFIPGMLFFYGLRETPPVIAAMVFGLVPLMFWPFGVGVGKWRLLFLTLAGAGIVFFYLGSTGRTYIQQHKLELVALLVVGTFVYTTGIAFCKKVLWIHSAQDLTCFAMFFAGITFAIMAWILGEDPLPPIEQNNYMVWLFFLGPVITGFGAHAYRYVAVQSSRLVTMTLTAIIPLGAFISGSIIHPGDTPLNLYTGSGLALYIVALVWASRSERPGHWMSHHFNNTRRKGDRVLCRLDGYMKLPKGPLARIEVFDISIGGLGFNSDTKFAVADRVLITFPLGENWTQISMEAKVAHMTKGNENGFPFSGGVEFLSIREDILQVLVEFLARLSKERDPHSG